MALDLPQALAREGTDIHGMAANLLRQMPGAPAPTEGELAGLSPGVRQMMSIVNHQHMTLLAEIQKQLAYVRIYEGEWADRTTNQISHRLFYDEREWRAVAFELSEKLRFSFRDVNYFIVTTEAKADELARQLLRGGKESDVSLSRKVAQKIRVSGELMGDV